MTKNEHPIAMGIRWIDINDPSADKMEELSAAYHLNPHIVRDCMQPEHLPKYEFVDDIGFLILRFYDHRLPSLFTSGLKERNGYSW
jgi:magnesium transporter